MKKYCPPREIVKFTPYDGDWPLLKQEVKDKGLVSVSLLVKEIVSVWAVDKRRDKRLTMPVHHYSRRNADDYTEAE